MTFYKMVIDQDIVDVNIDSEIQYVRYEPSCNSLLLCNPNGNAVGFIASDGSEIFKFEGASAIPEDFIETFRTVTLVPIEEEDYNVFKTALEEQKAITDPDPYIPPEPQKTPEEEAAEEEYRRSLQFVKDSKIQYMSYLCNQTIETGILITLSDGLEHHFALTKEDQINLMERQAQLMAGATQVAYHADNGQCTYYSAEDMTKIIQTSIFFKDYQVTYFNSLKYYINCMDDMATISAVEYGMEIPVEYQSQPLKDLLAQMAEQESGDEDEQAE